MVLEDPQELLDRARQYESDGKFEETDNDLRHAVASLNRKIAWGKPKRAYDSHPVTEKWNAVKPHRLTPNHQEDEREMLTVLSQEDNEKAGELLQKFNSFAEECLGTYRKVARDHDKRDYWFREYWFYHNCSLFMAGELQNVDRGVTAQFNQSPAVQDSGGVTQDYGVFNDDHSDEVVFIPSSKEYSTTNIISTIKALPES